MLGTVGRWLEVLTEWNHGLSDEAALSVIESFFGLRLPGVTNRLDLESALTPGKTPYLSTEEPLLIGGMLARQFPH